MSLCMSGSTIIGGQSGGGVLVSTNNGDTWITEDSVLPLPTDQSLPVVTGLTLVDSTLFAGTEGGVFRADISWLSSVSHVNGFQSTFELTAYPNPTNSDLYVNYSSSIQKPEISLFNILGERVMSVDGDGSGQTRLNVTSLAPGIYELVLRGGEQTATQTVIIER